MEPQPTNIDAIVALKPGAKWRYAVNSSGTTSLVWEDESVTEPRLIEFPSIDVAIILLYDYPSAMNSHGRVKSDWPCI